MAILVYKRTDASRDLAYQENLVRPLLPDDVEAKVFYNDDRDLMLRPTTRKEKTFIYCASLALLADTPEDMREFLKCVKSRNITLSCAEESFLWSGGKPIGIVVAQWQEARKHGAAMRGSRKSADTRKAETAAKLAQIEEALKRDEFTTRELLDRVGIRSINTIKNHFGITREQMQGRYRAAQKRKEARATI